MRQIDPSTGVPGRVPSRGGEPEELSESELRERGVLFDVLRSSDSRGGEAFDMQTAKALGQVPPVGTWRMDPVLGYLEQLQLVPVDELSFSESTTDPIIRRSVDKYVGYYQEGLQPPPADVVWNEPTQRLMTLNRRRVLAAKEAGVPSILAWVGGDTYENMKERAMRRRNPAELLLLNPADDVPLADESLRVSRTSADLLDVPFSRAARDAQWDIQFDQTPEDEQPREIINDLAANVVDQAFDDLPLVDWVEWAQSLVVSAGPGYDSDWPKAQAEAQRGGSTRRDFPRLHAIASRSLARLWTWDSGQPRRNPAATRPLSMVEVQQVMVNLAVPKEWRTRFMQGLNVEWSEHGGGIDARSVGALVVDHLNEDPNYYRRAARSNPHAAPPFVKKNLDNMLDRTGKTEDILTSLADIYAERAQAPQYAHSVEQMHQTEHALRSAAQSVEDVWTTKRGRRRHNPVESAQVEGADRLPYLDTVWSMYVASYSKIGLIVGRAEELLDEYDVWEISVDETNTPRAFCLYKRTPFGLKVGLSGSDGSPEGRAVARASFATKYQRPGVYGEVSHRPAELARAAGVPVVCANVASVVLRKQIDPVDDVHYVRNLVNVGPVQKMLVGMPLGVPTTDIQQPVCPAVRMNPSRPPTPDDLADLDAHYASVIGF